MWKRPQISHLRRELLKGCDAFVNQIPEPETAVSVGTTDTRDFTGNEATYTSSASFDYRTVISNPIVHIHGLIIQEWNFFLDQIFEQAVLFYLRGGAFARFPPITLRKFRLDKVQPTRRITEMRESISSAAKESFSWLPYKQRMNIIGKLLPTPRVGSDVKNEIKKHVVIRHMFEHHWGQVRDTDLVQIGRPNQYFEVLNDKGQKDKYGAGDTIALSKRELENLYEIIKAYSKNFLASQSDRPARRPKTVTNDAGL